MHAPFSTLPTDESRSDAGHLRVWIDRPGWILTRLTGRFEIAHCNVLLAASDRAVRLETRTRWVHDWREMSGFDMAVPPRLVAWTATHVRMVEHATIVARSPLIAMAARASNVTLKNLFTITTDEAELSRALAKW